MQGLHVPTCTIALCSYDHARAVTPLQLDAARPAGSEQPVVKEFVVPVMSAWHSDWIMRCHMTGHKAPGGLHCGGFCQCLIKATVMINGEVSSMVSFQNCNALPPYCRHVQVRKGSYYS